MRCRYHDACGNLRFRVTQGVHWRYCDSQRSCKDEGVSHHYLPVEFPSVPDFQMLKAIEQAAINLGLPYDVGVTITKASFYTQTSPQTKPVGPELIYKWEAYKKGGASSTSMECAPLFAVGASLGIRTSCVMASATNYESGKVKEGSEKVNVEDRAIRTAIEAMKIIIREDQKGE